MNEADDLVKRIRVASPCPARWEDMAGDDRKRFCNQCQLHVYNFSAMSSEEVAGLVEKKGGRLCGRFYKRTDGSVLTNDCPVGAGRVRRKRIAIFALVAGVFTALTHAAVNREESDDSDETVVERVKEIADDLAFKMGFTRRSRLVAGMVCIVPRANGTNSSAKTSAVSENNPVSE
ncbi:MAG TPA: hypothetical protein VK968_04805 [Roseimicrobium sp.]|nr:hypothetical protein [Roseimicrobium sp.]